jgi:hypothetical protein
MSPTTAQRAGGADDYPEGEMPGEIISLTEKNKLDIK